MAREAQAGHDAESQLQYCSIMSSADPKEYVETVVQRSGTSFYWAMRLLPREKREAIYGVYAFCREVDDIADGDALPADKITQLAEWRDEIGNIYNGRAQTPVGKALMLPVQKYRLDKKDFGDVIDGMETDAADAVRMETMADLELYCDRVACAVGRLSNPIFGVDQQRGEPVALRLGQALQITNILRDLHEDAAIDRLYVPAELLDRYGVGGKAPKEIIAHENFPSLSSELSGLAHQRFGEAREALSECDPKTMKPANLMLQNYARVLAALDRRGWSDLENRVSLSKLQKIWIITRYGLA